jgi:hypothetical protein
MKKPNPPELSGHNLKRQQLAEAIGYLLALQWHAEMYPDATSKLPTETSRHSKTHSKAKILKLQ